MHSVKIYINFLVGANASRYATAYTVSHYAHNSFFSLSSFALISLNFNKLESMTECIKKCMHFFDGAFDRSVCTVNYVTDRKRVQFRYGAF